MRSRSQTLLFLCNAVKSLLPRQSCKCHVLSASRAPSHGSAVLERRVAGQADLCPAVAAETQRPQLAADHGFEHVKADVVSSNSARHSTPLGIGDGPSTIVK